MEAEGKFSYMICCCVSTSKSYDVAMQALQSDNTHQGEAWDGDEEGNVVEKRVAQLLNDDEISMEYKEAFRQQTIIGW